MSFIIDGQDYTNYVNYVSFERSADFLDKYAKRDLSGSLNRELIGVFVNYKLKIGLFNDTEKYNQFWELITQPVPFHRITLPTTGEFEAYFANIKDEGFTFYDGIERFYGLTIDIIRRNKGKN